VVGAVTVLLLNSQRGPVADNVAAAAQRSKELSRYSGIVSAASQCDNCPIRLGSVVNSAGLSAPHSVVGVGKCADCLAESTSRDRPLNAAETLNVTKHRQNRERRRASSTGLLDRPPRPASSTGLNQPNRILNRRSDL
jgi:hypothetical protein